MPPGKRRQSNAMLYTLITFVGLFIVATTAAVIYYVKAEDYRTTRESLQAEMDALVNREEARNVGGIIGTKMPGHSNFGTLVAYLDEMVVFVKGKPVPQPMTAEMKVSGTTKLIDPMLERAAAFIALPAPTIDPNTIDPNNPADPNEVKPTRPALFDLVGELLTKLEQTTSQKNATEQQLTALRERYDGDVKNMQETEQTLSAKVGEYQQQVEQIKADYDNLRAQVQQNSDERAGTLLEQLEKTRAEASQVNQDLLKTQAELTVTQGRLVGARAEVEKLKPAPDSEAPAYKTDGEVILVDEATGIIHINLGLEDHIYRGLTFSVYDKGVGITSDSKPKAQVEVLAIDPQVSTARILSSERKNPVHLGDSVANLIWDADHSNQFVIAGEFDLDRNGEIDYDGIRKIETLIRAWGGSVTQDVTAATDFVILGTEPKVPEEPTLVQQTEDPMAMDRYNALRQADDRYQQIQRQAESLCIPIYNYDRFLSFTGYASMVGKAGAF